MAQYSACTYSRLSSLKCGHLDIPAIWFGTECYIAICLLCSLKYGHLALLATLHCPKGDRTNENLLYTNTTAKYVDTVTMVVDLVLWIHEN